jgi:hypothetical protein
MIELAKKGLNSDILFFLKWALVLLLQSIAPTDYSISSAIEHMGINLGCADISMPQQLLHSTNVVARLNHMRCKTMVKGMANGSLIDANLIRF